MFQLKTSALCVKILFTNNLEMHRGKQRDGPFLLLKSSAGILETQVSHNDGSERISLLTTSTF
jgi:hypothetical protein